MLQEKSPGKIIEVQYVLPESIAEEAGIESGDRILSINGQEIKDIFDYRFLISEEEFILEVEKPEGEIWEIEIEKDAYEDLGIEFENSMLDDAKSCTNQCIFCFIDQLPEGMRETLYFKDDDSRLSFLMGNYVTLTNMKDSDMERIIRYRMSPINVSVHTTNPELRILMLKNRFAGKVLERIKQLVNAGITVNCQIVACREINDGEELDRTIKDLGELFPQVNSVSVVPVGVTKHRKGLHSLVPYDRESSESLLRQVEKWQQFFMGRVGSRVIYAADEFYIMAEREIPEYGEYEDFPQIENGVGLVAVLRHEVQEILDKLKEKSPDLKTREVSIATGVSIYGVIAELARAIEKEFDSVRIHVYEIKNCFFGENVTVAGLLTGSDLISQLEHKHLGEELLISRSMLRSGENVFLDDETVEGLEQKLRVKISPVENNGKDFVEKILGIDI